MSNTSHRDLAAVLPYAEPVLVSPPLIPVWRGHSSTFRLCSVTIVSAGQRPGIHVFVAGREERHGCRGHATT